MSSIIEIINSEGKLVIFNFDKIKSIYAHEREDSYREKFGITFTFDHNVDNDYNYYYENAETRDKIFNDIRQKMKNQEI